MKKFFDSRRELVSSGPGSGAGGGGAGSGGGGSFIGRVFTIGRYQVTVEEIVAEGELCGFVHTCFTAIDVRAYMCTAPGGQFNVK